MPGDLKVLTGGRAPYPDVVVLEGEQAPRADTVAPVAVFEVLSDATALIDRRVKPDDCAAVASIQLYVILPQDGPAGACVRARDWEAEPVAERLRLPKIGAVAALGDVDPA